MRCKYCDDIGRDTGVYCIHCRPSAAHTADAYELACKTRDKLREENEKLKAILAKLPSENDDLGAEYTHVLVLQEEIQNLKALIAAKDSKIRDTLARLTRYIPFFGKKTIDLAEELRVVLYDALALTPEQALKDKP